MKISVTTSLPCSVSEAWDALRDPGVFQAVSAPFLRFSALEPKSFPDQWSSGGSYLVKGVALGFLPMGTQEIKPVTREEGMTKVFADQGRPRSGALGVVTTFAHTMTLRPSGVGPTILQDDLVFRAGLLTPAMWISFRLFWWWRHRRMANLAPSWRSAAAQTWDSRYNSQAMWSGKVNSTLEAIASPLHPGTALEVGAGEGADALWLAEAGWDVTAVELSSHALSRAEAERTRRVTADHQPRMVRWITSHGADDPLPTPPQAYDLVTAQFLHLPPGERHRAWQAMVQAVAPGGTLIIIGHSSSDSESGVRRPPAELIFDEPELRAAIPEEWSSIETALWPRLQKNADGLLVTVNDVALVARR